MGSSGRFELRGCTPRGLLTLFVIVLAGCGGETDTRAGIPASFEASSQGPSTLALLDAHEVEGRVGPDGGPFSVLTRTSKLDQYPCASCHVEPIAEGQRGTEEHANIQPTHPSELSSECSTCHAPSDPQQLTLQNGTSTSLDHAYKLCAQCHYSQADAWAGGAHGKRLEGWRGPRIVMNCTECHDPHQPMFGSRIPFRGPNIPRTGRLTR
jgi:hypothetical protein